MDEQNKKQLTHADLLQWAAKVRPYLQTELIRVDRLETTFLHNSDLDSANICRDEKLKIQQLLAELPE